MAENDYVKRYAHYKNVQKFLVELKIDDDIIIERIGGRRIHEQSNRTYHIKYNPPKVEGIDDVTGEPLTIRKEDTPLRIAERLKVYHKFEEPWFWPAAEKDITYKVDAG